jgi:hypothetical protein
VPRALGGKPVRTCTPAFDSRGGIAGALLLGGIDPGCVAGVLPTAEPMLCAAKPARFMPGMTAWRQACL